MKIISVFYVTTICLTLSICSSAASVSAKFDILFQNSFKISNLSGVFLKENFDPAYGNGHAYHYGCITDKIITLVAEGTNRLTGINANYIAEVLNGHNSPPFQSQLNCISVGLFKMQKEIKNARYWARRSKECFKAPSFTYETCDEFVNCIKPHQKKLLEVYIPKISAYQKYDKIFESIGMLDLFKNYINGVAVCNIEAFGIVASNLANVDQQEGIDYATGQCKDLSFPLSCISKDLDAEISAIRCAYDEIV